MYDAIVAGLGATGAATLFQLARRGARVLGIDRYVPPHAFGSSTGETRITRQAIGEGRAYVPLVLRSHALWREIERETGASLMTETGGLVFGAPTGGAMHGAPDFVGETVACAERYAIAHERLDADGIARRFPQFALRGDEVGYYEPGAGFLRPERCIEAQLALARTHRAHLATGERVLDFFAVGNGDAIEVRTDRGAYVGRQLVLAVGPWLAGLLGPALGAPFAVYRQVLLWFDVAAAHAHYAPGRFPIFIWMFGQGEDDSLYGFPAIDGPAGGIKVASEQHAATTDPDAFERDVGAAEVREVVERRLGARLRGIDGRLLRAKTCLYTSTPDRGFVVDRHPELPRVTIASPCSGHGFKHSAALGEAIAERVLDGGSALDLAPFALGRLSGPS